MDQSQIKISIERNNPSVEEDLQYLKSRMIALINALESQQTAEVKR